MITVFAGRLMEAIPTLGLVLLMVFGLTRLIPGDPAVMLLGPDATNAQIVALHHELHLDAPSYVQFGTYLSHLFRGDLGVSLRTGRPVREALELYLPATIELAIVALCFALSVGVPLGLLAARKPNGMADFIVQLYALCGVCIPTFLLAFGFQMMLGAKLHWLPVAGRGSAFVFNEPPTGFAFFHAIFTGHLHEAVDLGTHIFLPAIVLGTFLTATLARFLRNTMIEALSADYIMTAKAKGLRPTQILLFHAFPNAIGPAIMVLGVQFGDMLGGAILTETVFSWPGIGRYMFEAIQTRDYVAIQSTTLVFAIIFMSVSLCADFLNSLIDPRLRIRRSS
ncbi:peptide ABC transporter permease [Gluconobacter oxydans]|uniref:ABC transporter permease n=1 Tax=Gluconobacter thailandicus TaxID=257438 RepID=UPI0002999243|nr:ABC transporter permease [Gluconobacter thailandicus]AFW00711.1 ABC transporter permease [Gluconobacter oxydans H24]ANQ40596.1 peptide ABC transporter permease [Gluconobacter oxydans]